MQITRSVHPPGGAAALLIVLSDELRNDPPSLWLYPLAPVLSGALILLIVALVVVNIGFQYPLYWIGRDVRKC